MDLITNRNPFVQDSLPFLTLVEEGKVKLFVSEVSVGTLIYLSFERYKLIDAKGKLLHFMEFCDVISGGKEAFSISMNSDFRDKEDGIQYFTAKNHQMDFFISRDITDFSSGKEKFPVLSPKDFFVS
jgi:hypothetical protein